MSATLYALVVLQGTSLTFSPGYTTAAECLQQYKGPTLLASRMTQASAPGRRSLNPRRAVQDSRQDCQRGRVQAIHRCI